MSTNFAPYQDLQAADHSNRVCSPPPPRAPPAQSYTDDALPPPSSFEASRPSAGPTGFGNTTTHPSDLTDTYSTSLPIRPDIEAVLAYVALPPAGPALLLMLEHKSDYVRFHAWQSALVFTVVFVVHLIFSWTRKFSLILLVGDLVGIAFMAQKAYRNADSLERFELPFFGKIASGFVDAE